MFPYDSEEGVQAGEATAADVTELVGAAVLGPALAPVACVPAMWRAPTAAIATQSAASAQMPAIFFGLAIDLAQLDRVREKPCEAPL
jgi:hypothetical protein